MLPKTITPDPDGATSPPSPVNNGWRQDVPTVSLPEVHRSLTVPHTASFWRKLLAFSGPGYMVAVGYMDPGNWATDLAAGSRFGYVLLTIVMMSNLMAILLQSLALKLGIVSGRDLAQACRDHFGPRASVFLWAMAEVAIAACDLAEILGSAIALNLLFGIPLVAGVVITALDVLILLALQNRGFRILEAIVITLTATIAGCFIVELIFSRPDMADALKGFLPTAQVVTDPAKLYIAVGILGATVMPHNLYLHSSIVQTRKYEQTPAGKREAIKFATIDSTVALMFALFINAAILMVAAATFYGTKYGNVAEISEAYKLLSPVLGAAVASTLFAVALLASGQNSTLTATLAGQIVMEGFINIRLRPWVRRLVTRLIAIVPAIWMTWKYGASGTTALIILSQVVLSVQLSFAVFPLVLFTGDKRKMGEFANPLWLKILAWGVALLIAGLNVWLLWQTFAQWRGGTS